MELSAKDIMHVDIKLTTGVMVRAICFFSLDVSPRTFNENTLYKIAEVQKSSNITKSVMEQY